MSLSELVSLCAEPLGERYSRVIAERNDSCLYPGVSRKEELLLRVRECARDQETARRLIAVAAGAGSVGAMAVPIFALPAVVQGSMVYDCEVNPLKVLDVIIYPSVYCSLAFLIAGLYAQFRVRRRLEVYKQKCYFELEEIRL